MKIPRQYAKMFTARAFAHSRHLRDALRAPKQGKHGRKLLPPLRKESAGETSAFNGWSRARWFRRVAGAIAELVGAKAPDWVPEQPVFMLTIADEGDLIKDRGDGFELTPEGLRATKDRFKTVLNGLNYLGMIDVALVVSAQAALGDRRHGRRSARLLLGDRSQTAI